MYLIDTDICIEILRGNEKIRNRIFLLSRNIIICTTFINLAELYYGANLTNDPNKQKENISNLMESLKMLSFVTLGSIIISSFSKSILIIRGSEGFHL